MPKKRRVALSIDLSYPLRYHHGVFSGTQRYAREHPHWECVVQPYISEPQHARGAHHFDGIIARATVDLARHAAKAGLPLVNVWSGTPVRNLPSVFPDFEACGRLAAEHLLKRGYRHFAFHGFARHRASTLALAGFEAELRGAQCRVSAQLVPSRCDEDARAWKKYTLELEQWIATWQPPVAVLTAQDILCRYTANACLNAALRIPEDVALIGMGNEPIMCLHPEPSLSSFDLNYEHVGYEAAALLDQLMNGKPAPTEPKWIEPAELVVRRSTDAYAVDHPVVAAALRFIAAKSCKELRVETVAEHVHTTVRSLERHFRQVLNRTMSEEISRQRLERAKCLLVESDQQIKSLAHQCGFASVKHFHKVFKAVEGITPNGYRQRRK